MTIYIGLLRGINVGGKNKIKMAELRDALENESFKNVKTYIQSGNVVFESDQEENVLCKEMETAIKEHFGLTVPVILRTAEEWQSIRENCPFHAEQISKAKASAVGESLYVAILSKPLSKEEGEKVIDVASDKEECEMNGREIYLLFHDSIRNSRLANKVASFDSHVTVRNWKTINKLSEMVKSMPS
ncbi:MAG: DUF1697 domain-containing protein [Anaerobacillus sp.]